MNQRLGSEHSDSSVYVKNNEERQAIAFRHVTRSFASGLPAKINLETAKRKEKEEEEVTLEKVKKKKRIKCSP